MKLLLLSAKIMAGIHSGLIEGLQCSNCSIDVQNELNCSLDDNDTNVYYNRDIEIELPACPIRYITEECLEYYDRLQCYKKLGVKVFTTSPDVSYSYDNIPVRLWRWIDEYTSLYEKYSLMKQQGSKAKSASTSSNLSKLKDQFLKK